MSEEIKLMECPFCGGSARIRDVVCKKDGRQIYEAVCKKCRSKTRTFYSPDKAAMVWNGRVIGFTDRKNRS